MDDLVSEFLTETYESLETVDAQLVQFEQDPNNARILANIFRLVHTVKGTCGFLDLPRLEALAHAAETAMGAFRDGVKVTPEAVTLILQSIDRLKEILAGIAESGREPDGSDGDIIARLESAASQPEAPEPAIETRYEERSAGESEPAKAATIRVSLDTLEDLITTVSELVLTRNQLLEIARRHGDSEFQVPLQRLSAVTAELQDGVMKARMQPIGNLWQKLPRLVRDLAVDLGKQIELEMSGADTELDRQVLEIVRDPLTHLIRNCADHGLESAEERRQSGKPDAGGIRLEARHEGGHVIIGIADDGRGLDTAAIARKVLERGLASQAELEAMSDGQIHRFIFMPGFSTAAAVTGVSGRGVGMDVVRANVEAIGGSIEIESVPGRGTTCTMKLPLTLAIIPALIVEAGDQRFAFPQIAVLELVRPRADAGTRIERINRTPVLRVRDRLLPLLDLADHLGLAGSGKPHGRGGFICILQAGSRQFGVLVDAVQHTEEIVVKPMARLLRDIAAFSGTTILGDGSVIMILDPNGLAQAVGSVAAECERYNQDDAATEEEEQEKTPLLVFRAGSDQPKLVPLALVTRLEEVEAQRIERSNGRFVLQYRGRLIPVVYCDPGAEPPREGVQAMIVFTEGESAIALAVDQVLDILEDRLDVEIVSDRPGILGSAIVGGRAAELIDIGHFLPAGFGEEEVGAQGGGHILLVDDSAFFRNMLQPVLCSAGYRVTVCDSAEEALATLQAGAPFDAVVTDIEMPEINGYQLTARLRESRRLQHLPVFGLASHIGPATAEQAGQAGLQGIVGKFDRGALLAALEAVGGAALGEAA